MIGIDLRANFYKLCTYALLVLLGVTLISANYYRTKAALATANAATAKVKLDRAQDNVKNMIEANGGHQRTVQMLRGELESCQKGAVKMREEGENALTKAIAAGRDADAAFKKFMAQVDNKPKTCAQALATLDTVCSSLAGY